MKSIHRDVEQCNERGLLLLPRCDASRHFDTSCTVGQALLLPDAAHPPPA